MAKKPQTAQSKRKAIPINISPMNSKLIISDLVEIDRETFDNPWNARDFTTIWNEFKCFGIVAKDTDNKCILSYMFLQAYWGELELRTLVVAPDMRNKGIGTEMIEYIICMLNSKIEGANVIYRFYTEIRETNLAGQLFFKNRGLVGCHVLRNRFQNTNEDAYVMEYSVI